MSKPYELAKEDLALEFADKYCDCKEVEYCVAHATYEGFIAGWNANRWARAWKKLAKRHQMEAAHSVGQTLDFQERAERAEAENRKLRAALEKIQATSKDNLNAAIAFDALARDVSWEPSDERRALEDKES